MTERTKKDIVSCLREWRKIVNRRKGLSVGSPFLERKHWKKVSLSIVPKHILLDYFLPRRASKVLLLGVPPLGKV
jgi:hypothetical protein